MELTTALIEAAINPVPNLNWIEKLATSELSSILQKFDEDEFKSDVTTRRKLKLLAAKTFVLQHDLVQCYLFMRSKRITYETLRSKPSMGKVFTHLRKEFEDDELLRHLLKAIDKPEQLLQKFTSRKAAMNLVVQLLNKD